MNINFTLLLSSIVFILSFILLLKQSKHEYYGPFIRPTDVEGGVIRGSSAINGAVLFPQTNQECYQRCVNSVIGASYLDQTFGDLRLQECAARCGI